MRPTHSIFLLLIMLLCRGYTPRPTADGSGFSTPASLHAEDQLETQLAVGGCSKIAIIAYAKEAFRHERCKTFVGSNRAYLQALNVVKLPLVRVGFFNSRTCNHMPVWDGVASLKSGVSASVTLILRLNYVFCSWTLHRELSIHSLGKLLLSEICILAVLAMMDGGRPNGCR